MEITINTDGASRGNPGPASYGYIIREKEGVILHQEGKTIGITTNNIAEYNGVYRALEYIKNHFSKKAPHKIEVITDSQLVASQLSGKFKVKNLGLKEIFIKIKEMEKILGEVNYRNVPREQNFIADRLANIALDNQAQRR